MFRKSFMYLILIISLFFGFSNDVFAAKIPEITCRYYNNSVNWMITQKSDGTGKIWKNAKGGSEVSLYDTGWTKMANLSSLKWGDTYGATNKNGVIINFGKKLSDSNPSYLQRCPMYFVYYQKAYYIFEKKSSSGYVVISASKTIIPYKSKETKYIEPEVVSDSNKGNTGSYIGKSCPTTAKWVKSTEVLASCLYAQKAEYNDGCHVVQVDITDSGQITVYHDYPVSASDSMYHTFSVVSSSVNLDTLKGKFDGYCPRSIYVYSVPKNNSKVDNNYYSHEVDFLAEKARGITYSNIGTKGSNLNDTSIEQGVFEGFTVSFKDTRGQIVNCSDIIGDNGDVVDLLHMIVNLVKIIVPIMVIGLGSLDFVSAIFASDENNMKKAQSKFMKRLLIAVVIFLVPSLLHFILEIANNIWPIIDSDLCGIL